MALPSEAKRGFLLVIGAIAALYIGTLILARLPQ
jgi:hypothetical protein